MSKTNLITATVKPRWGHDSYNVEIVPGKSIRLYGTFTNLTKPRDYDLTFKVGDRAEWDSWNSRYTGTIVSIGAKTVTIVDSSKSNHRLDLDHFCTHNWDFDYEAIQAYNANESQYH